MAARARLVRGEGEGFSLSSLLRRRILPKGVKVPAGLPFGDSKWARRVANEAYGTVVGVQPRGAGAGDRVVGSGLVVHPLGLVLTARRNCVDPSRADDPDAGAAETLPGDALQVVLRNRTVAPARVVAECAGADVALLRLDAGEMTFAYCPLAGPEARPEKDQPLVLLSADHSGSLRDRLRRFVGAGAGQEGELAVRVLLASAGHWIAAGTMFAAPPEADVAVVRRSGDGPFRRHVGGFAFNRDGEAVGMLASGHVGSPHVPRSESLRPVLVPVDTVRQAVGASLLDAPPRPVGVFGAEAVPAGALAGAARERLEAAGVDPAAGGLYLADVGEEGLADHLDLARGDVVTELDGVPVVPPMAHLERAAGEMPVQLEQWLRRSFGAHSLTVRRCRGEGRGYGEPERVRVSFTRELAWDPLAELWERAAAAK